jgi:hypothetical protein
MQGWDNSRPAKSASPHIWVLGCAAVCDLPRSFQSLDDDFIVEALPPTILRGDGLRQLFELEAWHVAVQHNSAVPQLSRDSSQGCITALPQLGNEHIDQSVIKSNIGPPRNGLRGNPF